MIAPGLEKTRARWIVIWSCNPNSSARVITPIVWRLRLCRRRAPTLPMDGCCRAFELRLTPTTFSLPEGMCRAYEDGDSRCDESRFRGRSQLPGEGSTA